MKLLLILAGLTVIVKANDPGLNVSFDRTLTYNAVDYVVDVIHDNTYRIDFYNRNEMVFYVTIFSKQERSSCVIKSKHGKLLRHTRCLFGLNKSIHIQTTAYLPLLMINKILMYKIQDGIGNDIEIRRTVFNRIMPLNDTSLPRISAKIQNDSKITLECQMPESNPYWSISSQKTFEDTDLLPLIRAGFKATTIDNDEIFSYLDLLGRYGDKHTTINRKFNNAYMKDICSGSISSVCFTNTDSFYQQNDSSCHDFQAVVPKEWSLPDLDNFIKIDNILKDVFTTKKYHFYKSHLLISLPLGIYPLRLNDEAYKPKDEDGVVIAKKSRVEIIENFHGYLIPSGKILSSFYDKVIQLMKLKEKVTIKRIKPSIKLVDGGQKRYITMDATCGPNQIGIVIVNNASCHIGNEAPDENNICGKTDEVFWNVFSFENRLTIWKKKQSEFYLKKSDMYEGKNKNVLNNDQYRSEAMTCMWPQIYCFHTARVKPIQTVSVIVPNFNTLPNDVESLDSVHKWQYIYPDKCFPGEYYTSNSSRINFKNNNMDNTNWLKERINILKNHGWLLQSDINKTDECYCKTIPTLCEGEFSLKTMIDKNDFCKLKSVSCEIAKYSSGIIVTDDICNDTNNDINNRPEKILVSNMDEDPSMSETLHNGSLHEKFSDSLTHFYYDILYKVNNNLNYDPVIIEEKRILDFLPSSTLNNIDYIEYINRSNNEVYDNNLSTSSEINITSTTKTPSTTILTTTIKLRSTTGKKTAEIKSTEIRDIKTTITETASARTDEITTDKSTKTHSSSTAVPTNKTLLKSDFHWLIYVAVASFIIIVIIFGIAACMLYRQ